MSSTQDLPLVIALVAQNENQVLRASSDSFSEILGQKYRTRVIDLYNKEGAGELLSALKNDHVAFVYGFAGVGSQLQLDNGVNVWTASRVPFVAFWYDHPCYNYRQHIVDSPYVLHVYHVRDHIEARQKHLPACSSRAVLLPAPLRVATNDWKLPLGPRQHSIFYGKTALSPSSWIEDWQRHPDPLRKVLHTLAEQAVGDRDIDLADAAQSLFSDAQLATDNLDLFMGVVQEVDAYVRAWRSDKLARALLPFPAHIIGRGWEYLYDEPRQATFSPPIPPADYWSMCLHSKIVANSNPLWRDGFHERVWGGLVAGALVVSDRTVKADSMFVGVPNYIGFEWGENLGDVMSTAIRRSQEDDADYFQDTNKILATRGLVGYDEYIRRIEHEVGLVRQAVF